MAHQAHVPYMPYMPYTDHIPYTAYTAYTALIPPAILSAPAGRPNCQIQIPRRLSQ